MRVGFFADVLYYRIAAGSLRYAGELIRHLAVRSELELVLFSLYERAVIDRAAREREFPAAFSTPGRLPRPLRILLWHTLGWPGSAAGVLDTVDVVHTPVLLVPPRRSRPLVVTVHDLSFMLFPQYYGRWGRLVARSGLRRAVADADAFIVVSDHTARDLIRICGVEPGRVHVIPEAADGRFAPVDDPAVLAKYGIDAPFVLYLGTLEPRKNLELLLHAFAALEKAEVKLVLAGAKGWLYQDIFATVERLNLGSRVLFPGFVSNEDLPALISAAQVFVYPSVYEGFGLPVLEAMQCGTPVITTNVSSLPEVAGDAAAMVAPDDIGGLSKAMCRLLGEPGLRTEMRERGFEQAARFSWRNTAEQTAAVYREVLR